MMICGAGASSDGDAAEDAAWATTTTTTTKRTTPSSILSQGEQRERGLAPSRFWRIWRHIAIVAKDGHAPHTNPGFL